MKIGLMEIGILVVVFAIIFLVMRFGRAGSSDKSKAAADDKGDQTPVEADQKKRSAIIGIALILLGIVIIVAYLDLLKWVFYSYLWLLVAVLIIVVLLLFLWKRR